MQTVYRTKGADREKWLSLLLSLPRGLQDLHFHPDYLNIYEKTYEHKAVLFTLEQGGITVFQPFLVRKVDAFPRYNDITSVYGYGGPLSPDQKVNRATRHFANFAASLAEWKNKENIISEYCLLHPFFTSAQKQITTSDTSIEKRKDIVLLDLSPPFHVIWSRMHKMQRRAVNSARRRGVRTEVAMLDETNLTDFHRRYIQTMSNVGAKEFWKFPASYFYNCVNCLGLQNVTLFNAVYNGRTIASVFLIHMFDTVYYHFSCSDPEYKSLKATTLLIMDSILWAKSSGFKRFHFGGGLSAERDSLFSFKYSFCGNALPLFGYTKVDKNEAYDYLSSVRAKAIGCEVDDINFFPKYRG